MYLLRNPMLILWQGIDIILMITIVVATEDEIVVALVVAVMTVVAIMK